MSESQEIEQEMPEEASEQTAGEEPINEEEASETPAEGAELSAEERAFEDNPEEPISEAPAIAAALIVNVDGYEGPLDVLLMLARSQKVDLKTIAIVPLVDQYLAFIQAAKKMQLELAADYLVMAAWLTYLKSRLLIPEQEKEDDQPSGEEMAARLAFQLQRLQAMRESGAKLMARDRHGMHTFSRGMPEGIRYVRKPDYQASMYDLLTAYSNGRIRSVSHDTFKLRKAPVFAVEEARKRIENMFGKMRDWSTLDNFLPTGWMNTVEEGVAAGHKRKSARASMFVASLELAKEGHLQIKQMAHQGPIYVRWNEADTAGGEAG